MLSSCWQNEETIIAHFSTAQARERHRAHLRAIGARKSGKTPGIGRRFPVRSRIARTSAMIAACPLVRE
jgi:hypothetical protein